jgi:hypothetical protein
MPEINFLPQATETRVERQHRERGSESKETTKGIHPVFGKRSVPANRRRKKICNCPGPAAPDQTKSRRIAHSSRQRESMRERREPVIPTEVGRFFLALGL